MPTETRAQVGSSELVVRTGEYGAQADACVTVRYGDTMVLCAAVDGGPTNLPFMPLLVDYRERFYAAGRILGSRFQRREARPKDHEVLLARMLDRSIRPLFPEDYRLDTQLSAILLASDGINPADPVAMNAGAFALALSGIPVAADLGCATVAKVEGEFVVFPTTEQLDAAEFDVTAACTREKVVMIECGGGPAPEEEVAKAIETAFGACQKVLDALEEMKAKLGAERRAYEAPRDEETHGRVRALAEDRVAEAFQFGDKTKISESIRAIENEVVEAVCAEDPDKKDAAKQAFEKTVWEVMRRLILEDKRPGGRGADEIRPITSSVAALPRSHGSAVFARGQTQVLAAVTLGGYADRQLSEQLHGEEDDPFMVHYNFPAFSVGEVRPERGPGRRDIGHGHLARKALEPVLPEQDKFPYTVRIVAEVLESSASSSMATVCAGSLALMDAGVPVSDAVAGVSVGLVEMDGRSKVLTDIFYLEDAHGDMDFKVAGTRKGVTAIQVDVKNMGLTLAQVAEALEAARKARMEILDRMAETLAAPRAQLSELAPRVGTVKIPSDKIGMLIGPSGKNIRGLQEQYECAIDVEEDGTVYVSGSNPEGFEKVCEYLRMMAAEPEIGATYTAKVVSVKDFGAFCEFLPGTEGLLHISEIAYERIEKVEDVINVGDLIEVKLTGVEREGKYRLSRKALLEKPEGYVERPPREDRGFDRDDRRGGGRRDDRRDDRRGGGRGRR